MKEKRNITITDKKQIPVRGAGRDSIISWILQKNMCAELAEQKGSTAHHSV